jgi:hypothetical protein
VSLYSLGCFSLFLNVKRAKHDLEKKARKLFYFIIFSLVFFINGNKTSGDYEKTMTKGQRRKLKLRVNKK